MSFIKYQAFIKVVEFGNITKAAKALGYSQPGISHMLEALENQFGFPLLIRSKDSIRPTEDGKKILYYCHQIVKNQLLLQETADSITGLVTGTVHIGAISSTLVSFVPKLVHEFSNVYSNIEIHLQEYTITEVKEHLQNRDIDIAFTTNDIPKGYDFYSFFEDPICLVVNSSHPFAAYDKVPVQVLNGCDFIMPFPNWDDNVKIIQSKRPFVPNVKHYAASDYAAIYMVSENLGVYMISKLQLNLLPDSVVAKDFEEDFSRSVGICMKSFKYASPAQREFINIAKHFSGSVCLT
ncbi:MAG: LysR family transcriptional regulator [Lachnospiraceae bacterium]